MITTEITIDLRDGYEIEAHVTRGGDIKLTISVAECDVNFVMASNCLIGDEIIQSIPLELG